MAALADMVGTMPRIDGRADDELRPVTITRNWLDHAEGSVLVEFGRTRVLCAASVTVGVPRWRKGSGLGWVTARVRDAAARHQHPQRPRVGQGQDRRPHPGDLAAWSVAALRACVDYKALGENTIVLDCDVLQADGGTRTAAITGAYVALADAVRVAAGQRPNSPGEPLVRAVSAISVGIIDGVPLLDLCYEEDVGPSTDMNVVVTGDGDFVEVQGTAEGAPLKRAEIDHCSISQSAAARTLDGFQRAALATA